MDLDSTAGKKLRRLVGQAIGDYQMIAEGDRIMVCLSGGKDSYTLLTLLRELRRRAPVRFDLLAVHLDQKQPGYPKDVLPNYMQKIDVPFRFVSQDTYSIVKEHVPQGQTMCAMCSRLRRGILYRVAEEERCTKIALGHHADDILETFFLNLFFAGSLNGMPPKMITKDGRFTVIRPLALCRERDIATFAAEMNYPIIPCTLCGSQPDLKRKQLKSWLETIQSENPQTENSLLMSLSNIRLDRLMDPRYLTQPQGTLESSEAEDLF